MKKTLAIVLALVMVLCMIPAMSATTYETIADKSYNLAVYAMAPDSFKQIGSATNANSVTGKYVYDDLTAVDTDRWEDETYMAVVEVKGFEFAAKDVTKITIDGKTLSTSDFADYAKHVGAVADTQINFPVELNKAGYTDTFIVTVVSKVGDKETTETAKVTVKLQNTASYKDAKVATIINIASSNAKKMAAYIVGDKIYLDYVATTVGAETAKLTFGDENGKAFTVKTYYLGMNKTDKECAEIAAANGGDPLEDSAIALDLNTEKEDVIFNLETKAAYYDTKKYDIVIRTGIVQADPKGIYFAETTKTIAMGQTYTPVVMGVKTGKPVAATIVLAEDTDKEVVDLVKDSTTTIIGTREGVAYITAKFDHDDDGDFYTASSMKIVVTLPGESIPAVDPAPVTYYVTCRNLNVRAGAGTSFKKVDMIHRGDAVKVVEIANNWAKLTDGTYVCAKYIAK